MNQSQPEIAPFDPPTPKTEPENHMANEIEIALAFSERALRVGQ